MSDLRGRLLRAALGFLSLEPRARRRVQLLRRCLDTWRGVVTGMTRGGTGEGEHTVNNGCARALLLGLIAVMALAWPKLVLAQLPRAGEVITIEGNVTRSRPSSPPEPLALNDYVFVTDRIFVGDQSFVRLLLGGKAILAIRERSVVDIWEVPGLAIINLDAGAASLAVDTAKQRPGEMIEMRTGNASVGLVAWRDGSGVQREDVVIAEVSRPTAGACGSRSQFVVLRGVATVVAATGQTIRAPVKLMPLETVAVSGCTVPGEVGIVGPVDADALAQQYRIESAR